MSLRPNRRAHRSTPQQLADMYDARPSSLRTYPPPDHKACKRVLAEAAEQHARAWNSERKDQLILFGGVVFMVWLVFGA